MSFVRDEALELFAGALDWLTDDFIAVFIDDGFTPDPDTTTRLDDVPGGNQQLTVPVDTGKAVTNGVLSATNPDNQTFPTPDVVISGFLLVHDTGSAATSEVLGWYDRSPANLPIAFVTDELPVRISWPENAIGAGFISL